MFCRIEKTVEFSAAHHLTKVPQGHKCRNPHGHSYLVSVTLRAFIKEPRVLIETDGMLLDFEIISKIVKAFDHCSLNEHPIFVKTGAEPTAEVLAYFLYLRIDEELKTLGREAEVERVKVYETPTSFAEVCTK